MSIETTNPPPASPLAVVTGGTRGIGLATSARLLAAGWTVLAPYLRNRKAAAAAAETLAAGERYVPLKANVAESEGIATITAAVADRGVLHGLVLSAASGVLKPLAQNTRKHWDWTLGINAYGPLALVQALRPYMRAGTAVVALSSPGAVRAIPDYGAVGVSKAALEAIVRQLAYEWGPDGIRLNTVRAGLVPTEALDHFPDRDELERTTLARTPLRRLVQPDDVAAAVVFLLGPDAAAITGATLVVDGGAALEA